MRWIKYENLLPIKFPNHVVMDGWIIPRGHTCFRCYCDIKGMEFIRLSNGVTLSRNVIVELDTLYDPITNGFYVNYVEVVVDGIDFEQRMVWFIDMVNGRRFPTHFRYLGDVKYLGYKDIVMMGEIKKHKLI